jgi:hypothetical protein
MTGYCIPGTGRLDIFALGPNRELIHKSWEGSAWCPHGGPLIRAGKISAEPTQLHPVEVRCRPASTGTDPHHGNVVV